MTTIGIVSNGNEYSFLAFQLNTLNFDTKTTAKNILWVKRMGNLKSTGGWNLEILQQLVKILHYSVNVQAKIQNNFKIVTRKCPFFYLTTKA